MPHSLAPTLHAQFQSLQSCQVLSVQLPSATTCWSLSRHIGLPQLRPTRQQPQWSSRTEVRSGAPDAVFDAVFPAASNRGRGAVASFQSLRSFKIPLSREEITGKPTDTWDLNWKMCHNFCRTINPRWLARFSGLVRPCPQFHPIPPSGTILKTSREGTSPRTMEAAGLIAYRFRLCNWSVAFYEFSIFYFNWKEHSKGI